MCALYLWIFGSVELTLGLWSSVLSSGKKYVVEMVELENKKIAKLEISHLWFFALFRRFKCPPLMWRKHKISVPYYWKLWSWWGWGCLSNVFFLHLRRCGRCGCRWCTAKKCIFKRFNKHGVKKCVPRKVHLNLI